ncbi:hypothetical protein FOL47_007760 [Perkinsus chesapeaki]|uniref:FF domain-containing protein n=1 Tax=Perkinsus chesapeaki TaxID=330153 RepID=A0A7J6LIA0_PERCH|nr:hypothetical protein FOL47_007760 [Perkinsus chesapeaki]
MSDKNGNSSSAMTEKERKEAFNRMLEEYEISSKMKWHEVEKIIKDDWRFGLCKNNGQRKQFLSEYQSRRVKFEQTEGRHREMQAKKEFREQLDKWLNSQMEEQAEKEKKEAEAVNTDMPTITDETKKPPENPFAALMEDGSPLTFENVTFRDLAYAWRKKDFWKFAHEDELDHIYQDFMDENEGKMRDIARRDRIRKMDKLFVVYSKHPQVNRLTKWNDVCHFMSEKFPEEFRAVEPLDRLAVWERWIKEADEKYRIEREKAKRRAERKHRDKFREMLVHDYMEQIHNGVSWFDLHKDLKDREAYIDLIGSRNSSQPYDIFNDICKEVRREARQKRAQLELEKERKARSERLESQNEHGTRKPINAFDVAAPKKRDISAEPKKEQSKKVAAKQEPPRKAREESPRSDDKSPRKSSRSADRESRRRPREDDRRGRYEDDDEEEHRRSVHRRRESSEERRPSRRRDRSEEYSRSERRRSEEEGSRRRRRSDERSRSRERRRRRSSSADLRRRGSPSKDRSRDAPAADDVSDISDGGEADDRKRRRER